MPLTMKGRKIMRSMQEQYGAGKGKRVFYASANKGTISGVHREARKLRKKNGKMTLRDAERSFARAHA